ncbi:GGDEF domain-containing protein [Vibrio sinaloensis]|uniref:GGDEF domain-containing protein n=1 Tax=Photobacterium sp. (strain ATCC 43367) TaxID=379097 RepID=UPI0035EEEAFC
MSHHLIHCNATQQLRRKVLIGMCIVLGLAAFLFGLTNLFYFDDRANVLGIIELIYCATSFAMLFYIWKREQPSWFLIFHCVVLTFLISYGTYASRIESSLYLWAVALPTVFYLALGLRLGFYWSLACLLLELAALDVALENSALVRSAVYLNFVLAYVFVWTISHVYEDSRVKGVDSLNTLAHQDALTGAQNRLSLVTTFEQRAKLLEGCFLLTLDIDDFKSINDSYGHAAGDDVLKQVVERLATVAGQQHIYRMGGEEFVIVLPNTSSQQTGISRWVKQLQASVMGKPMCFQGSELEVTFSAGVEQFSQAKGLDKTLSLADKDLYLAKKSGKRSTFYQGKVLC